MKHALSISKLPINKEFSNKLANEIDEIIENYDSYLYNCKNSESMFQRFSEREIIFQWNKLFDGLREK